MHRCSVHSIRKVTERERLRFMRQNIQKPGKVSKTFSRNVSYVDVTAEEPTEDDEDAPNLPFRADQPTISFKPKFRRNMKPGPYVGEFDGRPASSQQPAQVLPPVPEDDDLNLRDPVNEYSPGSPLPEDVEMMMMSMTKMKV